MMRVQVRSIQMPRWLAPVLVLAAMAILPFALMLGLAVMAAVIGISILRAILPSSDKPAMGRGPGPGQSLSGPPAIDADYEVKDENEKGN